MEILRPLVVLFFTCGLLFLFTCVFRFILKIGWRLAILQSFITIGWLAWLITELLSIFKAVTFISLAVIWGIISLIILTLWLLLFYRNFDRVFLKKVLSIKGFLKTLPGELLLILVCATGGLLILGSIAFVASPNTWDSMTYHLSRVMHWQKNQSVAFYPTSIERQLYLGPMAETIVLNFQVLAGNDRLSNFVQFFSMLGCVVGGSLIAALMGGDNFAQIFGGMAILTLPMGILQSTSTQNDYVVALWITCFMVLMLYQLKLESSNKFFSFMSGISLGLAVLTKVTAVLFVAGFGLWLVVEFVHRFRRESLPILLILFGMPILLLAPHSYRNFNLYNNPLGPMIESGDVQYKYTNDTFALPVLASNVLRNLAIHLAVPFEEVNTFQEKVIVKLHEYVGIDINDARTTWAGTEFHVIYSGEEHSAGNPFHLLLIVASIFPVIRYGNKHLKYYSLCLLVGFILFSWVLKWQPWNSRLHLPLFILGLPIVGLFVLNYLNQKRSYLVMLVLFIFALPFILLNPSRPLLGKNSVLEKDRLVQYFAKAPDDFTAYNEQSKEISRLLCNDIGLLTKSDDMEYPIWVMADTYGKDIDLEHILVNNPSGKLSKGFVPCAIIVTYPVQDQIIRYQNKDFIKTSETGRLSLFLLSDE